MKTEKKYEAVKLSSQVNLITVLYFIESTCNR